jgi:hypothetical protein
MSREHPERDPTGSRISRRRTPRRSRRRQDGDGRRKLVERLAAAYK